MIACDPDMGHAERRRRAYERQKTRMAADPEYRAKIMEQRRRAADRRNAKLRASARNYDEP